MKKLLSLIMSLVFLCVSCQKEDESNQDVPSVGEEGFESLQVDPSFDYSTNANFLFSVQQEFTESNLPVEIYTSENFEEGDLLSTVALKGKEPFTTTFNLNKGLSKVYVKALKTGVPQFYEFDVQPGLNRLLINDKSIYDNTIEETGSSSSRTNYNGTLHDVYGGWNSQGLPNYLTDPDTVPQDLIDDIDASLPERRPVPTYNPQYLVDVNYDTKLTDSCDVWITFVHEGAGWRNSLGYYTYTTGSPPQTTDDIDSIKMVFPNVSFLHSGGELETGHKVYLGTFDENTSIGWVLIPNGWNASTSEAIYRNQVKYSNYLLNNDSQAEYKQHMVALKDVDREIVVLGFEDITRPGGDNDFNDCMFYLTSNPFAFDLTDIGDITMANDSDGDGAYDHEEEYPQDPDRAYNIYINNKTNYSTYGFEDMWPEKGDYDFNDVVIGVNYKKVVNTSYYIKDIVMRSELYAIGGHYHNGFGIEFPFNAATVSSISGQVLDQGVVTVGANGTEVGNTNASVIFFEDAYSLMSSNDILVNVKPTGSNYVTPHQFTVTMTMNSGQVLNSSFSDYPNPFIFVDQDRGREVHMPNQEPTELANSAYFGTYDDATNKPAGFFYKTSANHPWAINVVADKFYYPYEGVEVTDAYNHFRNWGESNGHNYPDWYKSKSGYRNSDKIYQRP
ncbi:LruC domain-containing protein [Flammeovirga aprica]|uniref:LruC domain-containing protein n=1 Tax=Flammeovirga aprica JL-4 TaxID=694437 RepID=A0A7X9RWV0_9BACT|nr:LruC domain-containing protein [Flammeovirga aprica]NME70185.1 LruC domain-containing protein [Flammeovirga aprica JL-4]